MASSPRLLGSEPAPGAADDPSPAVEVSVVVPVYNERPALEPLMEELEAAFTAMGRRWEVIFVDDGSTDGSAEVLTRLARRREEVHFLRLRRNFGKSAALKAGFDTSRGRAVVTIDGDGQDDPAEIPALVAMLYKGYDVVSGWKRERHDPALKRWGSRLFNRMTAAPLGRSPP